MRHCFHPTEFSAAAYEGRWDVIRKVPISRANVAELASRGPAVTIVHKPPIVVGLFDWVPQKEPDPRFHVPFGNQYDDWLNGLRRCDLGAGEAVTKLCKAILDLFRIGIDDYYKPEVKLVLATSQTS